MRREHLTEEELQAYAEANENDVIIEEHVKTCLVCKEQLTAYRLLLPLLAAQPREEFEFDLAAMVLEHLPERKVGVSVGMVIIYILAGVGMLTGAGAVYLLVAQLQFSMVLALGTVVIAAILVFQIREMLRIYRKRIALLHTY